jgi:hypothetical protein
VSTNIGEKDMNLNKNKTAIAVLLMLSICASTMLLQDTSAHTPPWEIPTYSYIHVGPNPVGVGQTVSVIFWINQYPPTAAGYAGDRWTFYLDIIAPDGKKTTQGPLTSDPVGGSFVSFTPDQTGTYNFTCRFPGQVLTGKTGTGIMGTSSSLYINDTYAASSQSTLLTVQEEAITKSSEAPLPTEYWTRPINGQNNEHRFARGKLIIVS